jgi:hypothetical protein
MIEANCKENRSDKRVTSSEPRSCGVKDSVASGIAEGLNEELRPTKPGGKWQAMSVRSVLNSASK